MIYILLIVFTIMQYLLCTKFIDDKKKKTKVFFLIEAIILIAAGTVRADTVGMDMEAYLTIFHETEKMSLCEIIGSAFNMQHIGGVAIYDGYYEFGYVLYNRVLSFISNSDYFFKFGMSLLIVGSVMYFLYRNSKIPVLSCVMYLCLEFYTISFTIIRQFTAIAIFLLFFRYVQEKDWKKFTLGILLASFFHKSALILLVVYPICNFKYTKKRCLMIGIGTVLAFLISKPLIHFAVSVFYPYYLGKIVEGEGLNYLLFLLFFAAISLLFLKKGYHLETSRELEFAVMFFVGIAFQLMSLNYSNLHRLALYFQIFILVFVPNCIMQSKKRCLLFGIVCMACLAFFIYSLLTGTVIPYTI